MFPPRPLQVVVVGAGLTGLTTAVLLARAGHTVTVLDRDPAAPPESPQQCWDDWQRPGVSQFHQPHLMLPRWHHELTRELPELADDLRGARRRPRSTRCTCSHPPSPVAGGPATSSSTPSPCGARCSRPP